jgi:hypothetical protein
LMLLALAGVASPAFAQVPFEAIGSRALGMAGAFVGVADDVTAAYWNPAALATGPAVGGTFEWAQFQKRDPNGPPVPGAGLDRNYFTGVGSLPLAITFGRLTSVAIVENPTGERSVERLSTSQFGGTILQTVVQGLIVGATFKYVRGTVSEGPVAGATAREAIEAASGFDGRSSGAFDLDVGLMADLDKIRLGLVVKNLLKPDFEGIAGNVITLPRLTRFGLAVRPGAGVTLAMDLDLDTVDLRDGLRRMIAFGAESPVGSRFALRGGVRWDLKGEREPVAAAGASVALSGRVWLDGHYSYGHSDRDQGFGFALRAAY